MDAMTDDVWWSGRIWRRTPGHPSRSRRVYYMATTGGRQYLHRAVYVSVHGSIPKGWHVHHVDHDPLNNDPNNLVAMSPSDHARHHGTEHASVARVCPECGSEFTGMRAWAKWCSPACKERWRRREGLVKPRPKVAQVVEHRECSHCGCDYAAGKPWQRFCSSVCKQRAGRLVAAA